MQKMKMSVCWMFVILLGCRLLHASQSQSTSICKHKLKTVCIPDKHNVSIPCPDMTGEDFGYTLFKDEKVIHNHTCSLGKNALNCKLNTSMGVLLERNNSSAFILTGVTAENYGIYRCEGMVTYPPPYINDASALRILVLVQGYQCKVKPAPCEIKHVVHRLHWIWISVVVVTCIYSIVVTIIAVLNYIKLRHSDSQSDYMNTKPRAPKDRKRKRGLENPIPRHF
ncbi:uncharacterized protein si:dkey-1h24.6 [Scomber scombrus]|uniref:uncharacterized protein si:dkey-1h24.6 n=1 Tax=Scomber scombrus TaxID=13677 RepID=UPI002DD7EB7E|nr:uncharacterized protein si:dkey-1h24.6 [Scomber scombrus]